MICCYNSFTEPPKNLILTMCIVDKTQTALELNQIRPEYAVKFLYCPTRTQYMQCCNSVSTIRLRKGTIHSRSINFAVSSFKYIFCYCATQTRAELSEL